MVILFPPPAGPDVWWTSSMAGSPALVSEAVTAGRVVEVEVGVVVDVEEEEDAVVDVEVPEGAVPRDPDAAVDEDGNDPPVFPVAPVADPGLLFPLVMASATTATTRTKAKPSTTPPLAEDKNAITGR